MFCVAIISFIMGCAFGATKIVATLQDVERQENTICSVNCGCAKPEEL